jgi:uncharacterized coiled-coil protein SlyX
VGGGYYNTAAGQYSVAAGQQAKAMHQGTFVWADSTPTDFASTGNDQFLIRAQGGVVINTDTPEAGYDLTLNGKGYAVEWYATSSKRWKMNIETIKNALGNVKSLRGVTYDWRSDGRHDIGLIAEEVGRVIPEVVSYEPNGKDAIGLNYDHLVPLLIEAAKDLDRKIETQDDLVTLVMDVLEKHDKRIGKQEELVSLLTKFMEAMGGKLEKQEMLERKVAEQEKTIQSQQAVIEDLMRRLTALEEKVSRPQALTFAGTR